MPEMPEVETLRKQLERVVVGQRIKRVEVMREKSVRGEVGRLVGGVIKEVGRRAKVMWWRVEREGGEEGYVLIHLKMTGQLVYVPKEGRRVVGGHPTRDWVEKLPSRHTRVMINLDKGKLFFNDMRMFGWLKIVNRQEKEKELAKYGPEVLSDEFTTAYLQKILEESRRMVKVILMDQKKVAGLGNIYVNDGLFCAGIKPTRRGKEISENEVEVRRLWQCLRKVIRLGLRYGGASERNYVHLDGWGGEYQKHFLVYGRRRCIRCDRQLRREKIGGRSSWWCENCQK